MQEIPFADIRKTGPVTLVEQYAENAKALVEASRNSFGIVSRVASRVALPIGDKASRRWLEKTRNPYLEEIDHYADALAIDGVHALNLCYEWGCTSATYRQKDNVILTRVLDWPFPALGENMVIAHQSGRAGDFYNITWPGVSGIFQAISPGKYAVALNQAPMRRYLTGVVIDWVRNRSRVNRHTGLPPAHLLRQVFESANSYEEAKTMLTELDVAIPVIYTLSGTKIGEGCVIERLEDRACIREMSNRKNVAAANHFETELNGIGRGWMPRATDSYGRAERACSLAGKDIDAEFNWFQPPVANALSRLALVANAAEGSFSVIGTDGERPVTAPYLHKEQ